MTASIENSLWNMNAPSGSFVDLERNELGTVLVCFELKIFPSDIVSIVHVFTNAWYVNVTMQEFKKKKKTGNNLIPMLVPYESSGSHGRD